MAGAQELCLVVRVPAVYLTSAIWANLVFLSLLKINNLRHLSEAYGFDSAPRRQQVSTAEKLCGFTLRIAGSHGNFAYFASKPDSEKVSCWIQKPSSGAHFSGGLLGGPV
jgi:hypothetical protein